MRQAIIATETKVLLGPVSYAEAINKWKDFQAGNETVALWSSDLGIERRKRQLPQPQSAEKTKGHTMKKTLATLAILAGLVFGSYAQGYSTYVPNLSSNFTFTSNTITATAAVATNGFLAFDTNVVYAVGTGNLTIDCRRMDTLALTVGCYVKLSNAFNATLVFLPSIDNVKFDANSPILVDPAYKTTNTYTTNWATFTTNIAVGGIGYLKFHEIRNDDYHAAGTNLFFWYATKR